MGNIVNSYAIMDGMEKYVLSGAVPGLANVKYIGADEGAYTTGDTIFLPTPTPTMTEEQLLLWRYYAEHEMGHEDPVNAHPHWREVMKEHKEKHDDLFWSIANLLSDHVQEHNRIGQMPGRDDVLLRGRSVFMKADLGNPAVEDTQMTGLGIADWLFRSKWNPHLPAAACPKKGPVSQEMADKVMALVDFAALKNEQEVYEAAKKLRALFPKEEERKEKKTKSKEGTAKPERVAGTVAPHDSSKPKEEVEFGDRPPVVSISRRGDTYISRVPSKLDLTEYTSDKYKSSINNLLRKTNLPAKVRAFLMAHKIAKWGTGYRSGRLDTSRLVDVIHGKDDVFRRREDKRMVNSAVSLLVDASGSMSGSTYAHAAAAAVMLADALRGVGVNVEIAAFTERGHNLVHEIILPFGSRFVKERVVEHFNRLGHVLANNTDGENILYAYNRLKRQAEPKKILVVISDGSPAGEGHPDNTKDIYTFTQDVINNIQKDKSVLLHGVGICGHDCRMYASRTAIEGNHMEAVLLNLAKGWIAGEAT